MMRKLLLIFVFPLLIAPAAEARVIKPAKAKAFLKAELAKADNEIAAEIQKQEPTLTLVTSQVNDCKTKRRGRRPRVDCDLAFTFRDQQGIDVTCELRVKVKYKSTRSKKLTVDLASSKVECKQP
jgi:hypothetical protein